MKVVYIIRALAQKAGVERVMSDKMNYLAEHGYEISVFTYDQGNHPLAYSLHPSINHIDFNICFFKISKYNLITRLGHLIRLRRHFRSRLQALLDDIEPDVMIVSTCSIKLMDIVLSVKTAARIVVESHAPCYAIKKSFYYKEKPLFRFLASVYDNWMLRKVTGADFVVTLTEGDADEWRKYTSKVKIIPNPISIFPDKVKSHDGCGNRILCVGRLSKEKRFGIVVDAFAMIADRCPQWRVDIYGEGSEKEMLESLIKQHQLTDRICINNPTSDIYKEYQESEFFVLSSEYEGFGLVLIEAMACGIPCISFRCKYGPEDIIDNGTDGLLVDDGDIIELSEKMLWMVNHKEERLRMGKNAREAVRRYQKPIVMQQWIGLFEKF